LYFSVPVAAHKDDVGTLAAVFHPAYTFIPRQTSVHAKAKKDVPMLN